MVLAMMILVFTLGLFMAGEDWYGSHYELFVREAVRDDEDLDYVYVMSLCRMDMD